MEVAVLYNLFHQSLLAYIQSKITCKEDAEDILHNVFIKIVEQSDVLQQKQNIRNWIFIVTRNAIYDYYRAQSKRQQEPMDESLMEQLTDTAVSEPAKDLEISLMRFMEMLPEKDKAILVASELQGIKQKDLAEQYQLPYSSLKSKVQRGREKLKQMLTDCCLIELDRRGNIMDYTPRKQVADKCGNSCKN